MMSILRPLLCLLLVFNVVSGFGGGPPESACVTMFPAGHGVDPQTTTPPYEITTSETSYGPNDVITVTITATGVTFNGFYLQARRVDPTLDNDEAIGVFSAPIAGTQLTCSEGCVSHNSPDAKSSITATWTAPATAAGHLQFRATIVGDDKETYWFGVISDTVTDPSAPAIATTTPRAAADEITAFDLSDCGNTKSCLQSSSGAVLTWALNGDVVDMEFSGKSDGWIGFGLSLDDQMGSDSVTLCIKDGDFVNVFQAYNEGRNGPAILEESDTLGLSNIKTFYDNGEIRCTFSRSVQQANEKYYNTDTDQLYTVLMAYGPASLGNVRKHEAAPLKSSTEANLRVKDQNLSLKADDEYFLKAHAACMVAAWMMCASLGLLLARYYRPAFPDTELCQTKVWFQLHRLCMVLTLLLTIAGFVVIFLDVEDLTDEASYDPDYLRAHPILGIIVTGLVIANPIMAIFRCHPEGANRYIYNWAHWLVGTTAHIAGLANIFLGLGFDRADRITPDYLKYVMVAFVVVHALTQLILEVKKCTTDNTIRVREEEIEMTNMSGKPYIDSRGADPKLELARYVKQSLRFQYIVLIIYVWVVLALGGVMIGSILKGDD